MDRDELDTTMRDLRSSVPDHVAGEARARGHTVIKESRSGSAAILLVFPAGVLLVSMVLHRPPGVIL